MIALNEDGGMWGEGGRAGDRYTVKKRLIISIPYFHKCEKPFPRKNIHLNPTCPNL
jgi:hypothetical protein